MLELYYATTNRGKVQSLKNELLGTDIKVHQLSIDLPEPRSADVNEIAIHKVTHAMNVGKYPVLSLDAGFYIPELNGFPKAYVNFALETIGIEGILKLLEGVQRRTAEFREGLAYHDGNKLITFESIEKGTIITEPIGIMQSHLWSELALIYQPAGQNITLAEMTPKQYLYWKKEQKENTATKQFAKYLRRIK